MVIRFVCRLLVGCMLLMMNCGKPEIYRVKEWTMAFLIDSVNIGLIEKQYTLRLCRGVMESFPERGEDTFTLWKYNLESGDSLELWHPGPNGLYRWFTYPLLGEGRRDMVCFNLSTLRETEPFLNEVDYRFDFNGFGWGAQHAFFYDEGYYDGLDSTRIYNIQSNKLVAEIVDWKVVNINRENTKVLIHKGVLIAYYSIEDGTIDTIKHIGYPTFISDYRYGPVALVKLDSSDTYTMLPDLDTLNSQLAVLPWITPVWWDRKIFNLSNGDYVYYYDGDAHFGNILSGKERAVRTGSSVRIQ